MWRAKTAISEFCGVFRIVEPNIGWSEPRCDADVMSARGVPLSLPCSVLDTDLGSADTGDEETAPTADAGGKCDFSQFRE